jgi:hypothetical protein
MDRRRRGMSHSSTGIQSVPNPDAVSCNEVDGLECRREPGPVSLRNSHDEHRGEGRHRTTAADQGRCKGPRARPSVPAEFAENVGELSRHL